MRHPSIRELYTYWNERRGARSAPDRADIEPGAIRRALADTFVLAFDTARGHPFRIAGTRVCAAFGRELKDAPFVDLWDAASRNFVRDLLTVVAHESVGVVASASTRNAEGSVLDFELVALPLRQRGRTNARILGGLAPTELPYWFGISALKPLAFGTMRYLGTGAPPAPVTEALPGGRIRRGLVIYDGGRA
jgi:hypothetical protein